MNLQLNLIASTRAFSLHKRPDAEVSPKSDFEASILNLDALECQSFHKASEARGVRGGAEGAANGC